MSSPFEQQPVAPAPKNKFDFTPGTILAILCFLVLIVLIAVVQGDLGSNKKVATPAVPTLVTTLPAPDPVTNKYDSYYEYVLNHSGQANSMSKADVIQLGDLVCQSLDEGNSVGRVAQVVADSVDTTSGLELGAAAIYAAITYICPEYTSQLNAYVSNAN